MQTFRETFGSHPIYNAHQQLIRERVLEVFDQYVDEDAFHEWHLCLHKFATVRPLTYFRHETILETLAFFNTHPQLVLQALTSDVQSLSHAALSLVREGSSWGREAKLELTNPEDLLAFESVWHPEYQRYCEHVFNHLIQVPLFVLGNINRANYQSQALFSRVELLRRNQLSNATTGYDSTVRNAISHGAVSFILEMVRYVDRNREVELSASEFSALFDNLVDTCHSLFISILLFLCENRALVEAQGLDNLPLGIRFLFVEAFASHSDFRVLSMFESEVLNNRRQINIACEIDSRSRLTHFTEALHVCYESLRFGGNRYNRFAVSLDSGAPVSSHLFINGDRLRQSVELNEMMAVSADGLIEGNLLWYDSSSLLRRLQQWRAIWKVIWPRTKREMIQKWQEGGFKLLGTRYTIRYRKNVSAGPFRRLEAHVVLHRYSGFNREFLVEFVTHVIKRLQRHLVRRLDLNGPTGTPQPPNYIWVRLYSEDKRIRRLLSMGWRDEELLLRAEWFSVWKNNGPIYVKIPSEVQNNVRVEFNPNLVLDR